MKRLTIADLDSIIYIVAYNHVHTKNPQKVIDDVTNYIDKIIEDTSAEAFVGYYQKEKHRNYRKKIFSGYKANRKVVPEDKWDKTISDILIKIRTVEPKLTAATADIGLQFMDLVQKYLKVKEEYKNNEKDWLKEIHTTLESYPGVIGLTTIESDDAASIMWHKYKDKYVTTISHIDKDLDCIPGQHQNYKDNLHYSMSTEAAELAFRIQVLQGDAGDGLPGIDGVGKVAAKKFVTANDSLTAAYGKAATRNYYGDYHCIRLLKDIEELEKLGKFKEVDFDQIDEFDYDNDEFD